MMMLADSFFQTANYLEAGLWGLMGVGFGIYATLPRTTKRAAPVVAAATFLMFGLSDLVEAQSGAWWRPWWLLVWKVTCVSILIALLIRRVVTRASRPCADPQPGRDARVTAIPNTAPP
jgi:hypothetical protein